jgi:putative intracellular protease/amidase/YHS domain-containing protein
MPASIIRRPSASLARVAAAVASLVIALSSGCATALKPTANASTPAVRLEPPVDGAITVAFVLAPDAEVVDFAGPWGVFEYVTIPGREGSPFRLITVAETAEPVRCSGGLTVVPAYTFANAPPSQVLVIPAMGEPSPALLAWVRSASESADLTVSICTGAIILAETGLLDGHRATTHHGAYGYMTAKYPRVTVVRGARFVDSGRLSTSGGLTSGIDLALHVVDRYYGRAAAERTATDLEYQGRGWLDPNSNAAFAQRPVSTPESPVCPICEMAVSKDSALRLEYAGRTYYFCCKECEALFLARPDAFQ